MHRGSETLRYFSLLMETVQPILRGDGIAWRSIGKQISHALAATCHLRVRDVGEIKMVFAGKCFLEKVPSPKTKSFTKVTTEYLVFSSFLKCMRHFGSGILNARPVSCQVNVMTR